MRTPHPEEPRVETITAALIYLMSHYAQTGCPRLAICVARHMQCLSLHADAAPVLRDICAALHGAWQQTADRAEAKAPVH
jgi:hypothetical protein